MAKDTVSKNLIISKVFSKKILKLLLRHWIFSLEVTFLLMLLLNHYSKEKQGSKRDLIYPIGLFSFKIVFLLLAKTIII